MKKSMLFPLLTAVGGAGAFLLRLVQRATGFEADTGLPIPGNLPAMALVLWFVVLAAAAFFAARALLPAEGEDSPLFPDGFSTASAGLLTLTVMGILLLAVSGAADIASGIFPGQLVISADGTTAPLQDRFFSQKGSLILGALSLGSAATLFPAHDV